MRSRARVRTRPRNPAARIGSCNPAARVWVQMGCTALHYAAYLGRGDMVHALLGYGADPTRRNRDGVTAAEVAEGEKHTSVAAQLSGVATHVEEVDLSWGTLLEGELQAKRTTGLSLALFRWKAKHAVLSLSTRSLLLWAGSAGSVEGGITRVRLDQIETMVHDAKAVRARAHGVGAGGVGVW